MVYGRAFPLDPHCSGAAERHPGQSSLRGRKTPRTPHAKRHDLAKLLRNPGGVSCPHDSSRRARGSPGENLYHEHGRGSLVATARGERAVKPKDWKHYEILAIGPCIWTAINGRIAVADYDPDGEREGFIALQIPSGAPQAVRYRVEKLIHNPEIELPAHNRQERVAALRR